MDSPQESWKNLAVIGYSGYDVSDSGRVRNAKTGYVLSQHVDGGGYKRVNIRKGPNSNRLFLVHRLVAAAFLPGNGVEMFVHHVNHDRTDARLGNLKWVDRRTNNMDKMQICRALSTEDVWTLPGEKWQPVALDYMTHSQVRVSDLGRVSIAGAGGRFRITRGSQRGVYLNIHLSGPSGMSKCHQVHRIVAKAFCHNADPDCQTMVNHISGDTKDNRAVNLQWVTPSENSVHSYRRAGSIRKRRGVQQRNVQGELISHFDSVSEAARKLGLKVPNICKACSTDRKCGGFRWCYSEM